MGFIALRCPSCGAEIELDSNREFGFCSSERHKLFCHFFSIIQFITPFYL